MLTHFFGVNALALTVCSMMGLALGVDYALLMVSRFREEMAEGSDPLAAAWATRRTAGRTTVFAGSTLVLSMVVAMFVVPGALLVSLAGTLALVVLLTVVVATVVGPPILVLLGPNLDRWRIGPAPNGERSRLMLIVGAALRRPAPVAAAIAAVVLVLAAPALALKTGPFTRRQLPRTIPPEKTRNSSRTPSAAGFEAPFVVVAVAKDGTITEPKRLAAMGRWQHEVAETEGVQSVIGPGQVAKAVEPLRRNGRALLASNAKTGPIAKVNRLGRNLNRAADGVETMRHGIALAANGAGAAGQGRGQGRGRGAAAGGRARHGHRRRRRSRRRDRPVRRRLEEAGRSPGKGGGRQPAAQVRHPRPDPRLDPQRAAARTTPRALPEVRLRKHGAEAGSGSEDRGRPTEDGG